MSPRLTAEAGPLPLPLAATTIKSLTPDGALGHDTVLEPPLDPREQRAGKVTWFSEAVTHPVTRSSRGSLPPRWKGDPLP